MTTTACWVCEKSVPPSMVWTNRLKDGTLIGSYCSKVCARSDAWGPKYRESESVREPKP